MKTLNGITQTQFYVMNTENVQQDGGEEISLPDDGKNSEDETKPTTDANANLCELFGYLSPARVQKSIFSDNSKIQPYFDKETPKSLKTH